MRLCITTWFLFTLTESFTIHPTEGPERVYVQAIQMESYKMSTRRHAIDKSTLSCAFASPIQNEMPGNLIGRGIVCRQPEFGADRHEAISTGSRHLALPHERQQPGNILFHRNDKNIESSDPFLNFEYNGIAPQRPAIALCFDFDQTLSQLHIHRLMTTSSPNRGVDYVTAFGGPERIHRLSRFLTSARSVGAALHIVSHGHKDQIINALKRVGLDSHFPKDTVFGWDEMRKDNQIAASHGLPGKDCYLIDDDEDNLSDAEDCTTYWVSSGAGLSDADMECLLRVAHLRANRSQHRNGSTQRQPSLRHAADAGGDSTAATSAAADAAPSPLGKHSPSTALRRRSEALSAVRA